MPEGAGVVQAELVHALHQAVGGLLGGDVPGVAGHVGLHIARVQNGHGDALVLQVHGEGFAGGVEAGLADAIVAEAGECAVRYRAFSLPKFITFLIGFVKIN